MYFFFQAEDGIRDDLVTGVQTCALPISLVRHVPRHRQSASRSTSQRLFLIASRTTSALFRMNWMSSIGADATPAPTSFRLRVAQLFLGLVKLASTGVQGRTSILPLRVATNVSLHA